VFASKQVLHQRLLRTELLRQRSAVRQNAARPRGMALELPHKTFSGSSSARQLAAGSRFSLSQHAHYPETGDANQFKLLTIEHAAANNLPAQMAPLLAGLGGLGGPGLGAPQATSPTKHSTSSSQKQSAKDRPAASVADAADGSADASSDELAQLERGTYRNRFTCVRAVVPVVPLASSAPLRATALGPQTAIVVGLAGEQVTTQRNHGVKVQFAWQRGANPLPGGLSELNSPNPAASDSASNDTGNAPGNETSGTWVRVAEALAGPNWGSQFTPRIGTEVLVDFLDGDMDQPVVVAQLYNGVDSPPFAAGVDAGVNHGGVISGWHSHNHTDGYNTHQTWLLLIEL
jgi:type VI secretion system secreted protein VgrG